jgi:Ca2+-binding EF-hand superfamily protein
MYVITFVVYHLQFCDFDESGDGSIAASELVVLMKSMGIHATLEEVQVLIDKVDENRSGELEYHEFVRVRAEDVSSPTCGEPYLEVS